MRFPRSLGPDLREVSADAPVGRGSEYGQWFARALNPRGKVNPVRRRNDMLRPRTVVQMSSCVVTENRLIITLEDGRVLELSRPRSDAPEKWLSFVRQWFLLDEVSVNLAIP